MVSLSFPGGRSLFLVLALVLVCMSLCVPRVVGDFGFSNWSPPSGAVTQSSTTGTPSALEFQGKIHVVYRDGLSVYWVTSTDGVTFTAPLQFSDVQTRFDPSLVVMTDSATGDQTLVMLTGGGVNSARLFYVTFNPSTGYFNYAVDTNAVSDLNGNVNAVYSTPTNPTYPPPKNQLIASYVSTTPGTYCAYGNACPTNGGYYMQASLTATLTNGQWAWSGPTLNTRASVKQWSPMALFNTDTWTFMVTITEGVGQLYSWIDQQWDIVSFQLGSPLAFDAPYSGVLPAPFTLAPLLCDKWIALWYINPSNTALAYSLVSEGYGNSFVPKVSGRREVGFNDGEGFNMPSQPSPVYFSATNTMYVYYVDNGASPHRIQQINATLGF